MTQDLLTTEELQDLARYHNWGQVCYDNGVLSRRMDGSESWEPVTDDQITKYLNSLA